MVATSEIVHRALKEIRVASSYDGIDAIDAKDALDKLNSILHGLANDGTTYEHTYLALTTTYPLADSLVNSSVMWLAKHIAGQFGKTLSRDQYYAADEGEEAIFAAYFTVPDAVFDSGLVRLPSNRKYWGSS